MRSPRQRLADLRAQAAANRIGELRLGELAQRHGLERLRAGMEEILAYAERRTRAALAELPDGAYAAEDLLEDDANGEPRDVALRLEASIRGDRLVLDFSGTDGQIDGNLNCPLSVTRSAAFFAVRVLTDPDAPPCAGAYRPIEVIAPAGCLLNARFPAAVAAGNVETSGRVADLTIAALAGARPVPAQGQGTMNNLTLAGEGFTYYETLGGGQGACPDADGPSAIHVAMSNTLNTPVEALELAYPLRVERYSLRPGSGGAGAHRGGDGVIRELRALERCRLSLLSQRRRTAPRGAAGGGDGAPGRNLLNGKELPPFASRHLDAGDVVTIETPGGGGYGPPRHAELA
jgi:N-methylhydantoinase B